MHDHTECQYRQEGSFTLTIASLRSRAQQGCQNCGLIWQGIEEFADDTVRDDQILCDDNAEVWVHQRLVMVTWTKVDSPALRLEFFTDPNEGVFPAWCDLQPLPIISEPASTACFDVIRRWIDACSTGHAGCPSNVTGPLPHRVIDVHGVSGTKDVVLYESRREAAKYITLSHCWGQHQPLTTTGANLQQRKSAIPWTALPKTFQDAVLVTRELGVQYLWIDSLCILQDDRHDWIIESARMDQIYMNSWITLSAARGAHSNHGCFRRTSGHETLALKVHNQFTDVASSVFARKQILAEYDNGTNSENFFPTIPIFKRAWVLQERLLPGRVLHFMPDEMFWECSSQELCECGHAVALSSGMPSGTGSSLKADHARAVAGDPELGLTGIMIQWYNIVARYLQRTLTFETDKLPAFSGVAKQFRETNKLGTYLAGLWSVDLPKALLWHRVDVGTWTYSPGLSEPLVPSWSWASVSGTWQHEQIMGDLVEETSQVIDFSCTPASEDPTGAVSGGHITLRGYFASAWLKFQKGGLDASASERFCGQNPLIVRGDSEYHFHADYLLEESPHFLASGQAVFLLQIAMDNHQSVGGIDCFALVLQNIPRSPTVYRRIGLASIPLHWFDEASRDIIKIL